MIQIAVTVPNTNQTVDFDPLEDFIIPLPAINENLQHQELTCTFRIAYDAERIEFLLNHEVLNAVVYDGETPVFTGTINNDYQWQDKGRPMPMDSFTVIIADNTQLFDRKTTAEFARIGKSLKQIASDVCTACGTSYTDSIDLLDDTIVPAFVVNTNKQWLEVFNNLLFQYGFTFYFNGAGEVVFLNLNNIKNPTVTLTENDMMSGVDFSRTSKKYTGVTVTYNELIKKQNEQVYWEGNGLDDDNKIIPITILPGQYYPYASDPSNEAREGTVYQNFENGYADSYHLYNGEVKFQRTTKTQLVYTENHRIRPDWEGEITINRTDYGYKQASVRLRNDGSTDAKLYQLAIVADAYYRSDNITVTYGTNQKPYEYQTEFVYTSEAARNLAAFLSRFVVGGKYRITCRTDFGLLVGTCVSINSGISGFHGNAYVISCEYEAKTELYKIVLITYGDVAIESSSYKSFSSIYSRFSEQQVIAKSLSSITEQYYLSTSSIEQVNGQWQATAPKWEHGKYIWTRSKILYNSGDVTYTSPLLATALDGVGIASVDIQYAQTDNALIPPTSGWSTIAPEYDSSKFSWSRIVTTFTNGEKNISDPVVLLGVKGDTGDSIQYLGFLSFFPETASNGQFFLAKTDFIYSGEDLKLIDGFKLKLLNGNYLSCQRKAERGTIYLLQDEKWIPVTDRNNFRYIIALNDLKQASLPLPSNFQQILDEVEDYANEYTNTQIEEVEESANSYTDEQIKIVSNNLSSLKTDLQNGTVTAYQPHYLGKRDSAPSYAKNLDWYVDTTTQKLMWLKNGNWQEVTEYTDETAHLYNAAAFDLMDYTLADNTAIGQFAAAFINKIFTREIVLKDSVGVLKSQSWDDVKDLNKLATGAFALEMHKFISNDEAQDMSDFYVDEINTGLVTGGKITLNAGRKGCDGNITLYNSDSNNETSFLDGRLEIYPSVIRRYNKNNLLGWNLNSPASGGLVLSAGTKYSSRQNCFTVNHPGSPYHFPTVGRGITYWQGTMNGNFQADLGPLFICGGNSFGGQTVSVPRPFFSESNDTNASWILCSLQVTGYNNSKTVYPIDIANDGSSFKVAGSGEVTWLAVFMNLNAL